MSVSSYSQEVRSHLAGIEVERDCCRRAQLLALLSVCATEPDGTHLLFTLESGSVARCLFRLVKQVLGGTPHLADPEGSSRHGPYRLWIDVGDTNVEGLASLQDIRRNIQRRSCCRRSFLRGAVLGCGSLVDPERAYHLEFTAPGEVSAWIVALLQTEGIRAGHYQRPGHTPWTVYVKKSQDIATFLTLVGAVPALLALEELLISRDLKNNVQRAVNCETANLDRTVVTAQDQIALIEVLESTGVLAGLDETLQQTAHLRVEHPYASLAQLAELHDPPMSKSAINHRLRKLVALGVQVEDRAPREAVPVGEPV